MKTSIMIISFFICLPCSRCNDGRLMHWPVFWSNQKFWPGNCELIGVRLFQKNFFLKSDHEQRNERKVFIFVERKNSQFFYFEFVHNFLLTFKYKLTFTETQLAKSIQSTNRPIWEISFYFVGKLWQSWHVFLLTIWGTDIFYLEKFIFVFCRKFGR